MMSKADRLDQKEFNSAYNDYKINVAPFEKRLIDRTDYIVHKICEVYHFKLDWWDLYFHEFEGEASFEWEHFLRSDEQVEYCLVPYPELDMGAIIEGAEWGFETGFPRRWLFEDFEKELVEGKKSYEQKQEEKKRKNKQKREAAEHRKKNLIENVKSKLTKEEIKALGIK